MMGLQSEVDIEIRGMNWKVGIQQMDSSPPTW